MVLLDVQYVCEGVSRLLRSSDALKAKRLLINVGSKLCRQRNFPGLADYSHKIGVY